MRILIVLRQNKNLEAFLGVIRSLLDRGHHVTTAIQEWDGERDERVAAVLQSDRFTNVPCPPARLDGGASAATLVRSLRDCVHYLRPELREAAKLQARTVEKLRQKMALPVRPAAVSAFLRRLTPAQVEEWETVLAMAERSVPPDPILEEFIASARPDVVLVSPLVHFGSAQADVIATAGRLGIPTGMLLYSWDNLSTKGCLHRVPDRMFVWNAQQRDEARTIHGYPAERVAVVGAPRFDEFFALQPMLSREVFHAGLGLDPSRPTLLYLCSSRFVTKEELPFVRRWIAGVRSAAAEPLRSANIIVRPHPDIGLLPGSEPTENRKIGHPDALRVRIARPFDDPAALVLRTSLATPHGLFESIFHSAAVVGLNTTAELEAGIVGRPVFTVLAEGAEVDGQQTTLHFHYLLKERGGFVSVGRTFADHLAQLDAALREPADPAPIQAFIREFLRPHGLDRPVGPIYAEAIEQAYAASGAVSGSSRIGSDAAPGFSRTSSTLRIDMHESPELARLTAEDAPALDAPVVEWLQQSVAIGDVLYDIGAGAGLATVLAARHRGAVVVAFEPGYAVFGRLCENVRLNGCQDAVIPLPLALSHEEGLKELKYDIGGEGQDRHRLGPRDWRVKPIHSDRMYVQPVCVSPLDAVIRRHRLPAPNHLRLSRGVDVVGVLQGARGTLASPALKSLCI
ncbi:MAG: FkbM family methyltransferase, partial [Acidobacteria bacterium]|nr:FkbM family methyltransferase [Acidobacteriota bacterium]